MAEILPPAPYFSASVRPDDEEETPVHSLERPRDDPLEKHSESALDDLGSPPHSLHDYLLPLRHQQSPEVRKPEQRLSKTHTRPYKGGDVQFVDN